MIITDHFIDGRRIGITLPFPAQEIIEVFEMVLTEYNNELLCLKDYHITFKTLEGEVEYLLASVVPVENKYTFVLVEDRRNVK